MAPSHRDSPGRQDALAAALIFIAALIPRVLYVIEIDRAGLGAFLRLDPLYYQQWALRIAGGDWLGHEAFEMAPLYPYALAVVYKLFGAGLTLPRILQAVLGAATCSGTFLLGKRLFGRAAGIAAGAGLAAYGPAIYYDGQINKTTLALALSLAFAGLLVLSERRRGAWIAAGGACLGLTALVHENVNVAAPVLLLWLLWPARGERLASRLRLGVLFVAGYAAVVLPVTARNVLAAHEYVLITSAGGENFYTGNNPDASGRYGPPPFVRPDPFLEHEDFRTEAARRLGHPVTRHEASAYWWHEGLRFIAANPVRYLRLLWDKFSVFFNAFERPDNFSYANFRLFSRTLSLPWLGFAVVMPLALAGIVLSARRWAALVPIYAAAGAYVASGLIFFTQSRYRMPAVPFFCLFAGHAVASGGRMIRGRAWRPFLASAVLVAGSFLFVTQDPGNSPGFDAQNDAILGELYYNAGRYDDAAASFTKGLGELESEAHAGSVTFARIAGGARYGLGLAELKRGHDQAAEASLRIAARCPDPDVRRDAREELILILSG
ncbi:MAG TPA: glycosyltransferase family 39 protein, partial [Candidatus Saccharimonadales bacterium]|nr:glycosyltransferase family 39 protein [Candidatus Saccharimonadales bacterium]